MTSAATAAVLRFASAHTQFSLTAITGGPVAALVLAILIEREILSQVGDSRGLRKASFTLAGLPLLLILTVVITVRFLSGTS